MFFRFPIHEKSGAPLSLRADTVLRMEADTYRDYIESSLAARHSLGGKPIAAVEFHLGLPGSIKRRIAASPRPVTDEAYVIVLGVTTRIYAVSERGFIFAASTLCQLCEGGELCEGFLYDSPIAPIRGYRVYLPSRAGISEFYRMVDFLAYYKYNAIILEIGGAMAYHRHPEINEKWAEFCKDTRARSGRTKEIQFKTYAWPKNSIHCDNAEGDILTQEECRAIAAYCRSRGMSVIPECPSLSHCDFLVMAHPELREREADGHPDTYCPRHPEVYGYVFDILEEVIDVFAPTAINIGHDETYSIGICPRCKGTPAYRLYAEDTNKIYAFLNERGIHTYMWGEKLLNAQYKGQRIGGAGHGTGEARVPSLWPCRDLLPRKNITYLHWYWRFNDEYDNVYHDRGMHVIYGNLQVLNVENWNKRRDRGINGGFISNWGSFSEEHMQRNQQYLSLLAGAYAFFCDDFEARGVDEILKLCFREGYRLRSAKAKHPLEITHTSEAMIPYEPFYDGIFVTDEKYLLGRYELSYTDGTVATLPVRFGTHVGPRTLQNALRQPVFTQLSYGTLPHTYAGGFAYRVMYEDPHPDKTLSSVRFLPLPGREDAAVALLGFSRGVSGSAASLDAVGLERGEVIDGLQE